MEWIDYKKQKPSLDFDKIIFNEGGITIETIKSKSYLVTYESLKHGLKTCESVFNFNRNKFSSLIYHDFDSMVIAYTEMPEPFNLHFS